MIYEPFQKVPEFEWDKDIEASDRVDGKVTMTIAALLLVGQSERSNSSLGARKENLNQRGFH